MKIVLRFFIFLMVLTTSLNRCQLQAICSSLDPTCDTGAALLLLLSSGAFAQREGPDFNGVLKQDLAFSSDGYDVPGFNTGIAFVIFSAYEKTGTLDAISQSDVVLEPVVTGSHFGTKLLAGDFNGDAIDDLLVTTQEAAGGSSRGRVYVFFGGPGFTGTIQASAANVTITGTEDFAEFGWYASSPGDTNADGIDDFLICSASHTGGGTSRGRCFLYFGKTSFPSTLNDTDADVLISGVTDGDRLGSGDGQIGDLTGDGIADIVTHSSIGANGVFHVFPGRTDWPSALTSADSIVTISWPGGTEATFATGDVNGDTSGDLIIATDSDYHAFNGGTALSGNLTLADDFANFPTPTAPTNQDHKMFDLDGNGIADLILPEPQYNLNLGEVRYVPGNSGLSGTINRTDAPVRTRIAGSVSIQMGTGGIALSTDSDSDGIKDLWIGAWPNALLTPGVLGEIYLFPSSVFQAGGDIDESSAILRIAVADYISRIAAYPR